MNQESGMMNQGSTRWTINPTTGQIFSNGFGLDMAGADITNVKAIMSASGNWLIGEDGNLVTETITAKRARLNELELIDKTTGAIYCTWIENEELRREKGECAK